MPNLRTFGMTWGDFAYAFGQGLPASVRGIMNGMRIPQTYYPRESLVHRLDARVKLALLIAVTIALFQVTTWRGLAVFALLVLLALKASHLPPITRDTSCTGFFEHAQYLHNTQVRGQRQHLS